MTHPLLQLCARATTFPQLEEKISKSCASVTDWDGLLATAEQQGLAPLLHRHLTTLNLPIPAQAKRSLHLLALRHRGVNAVLMGCLKEVLALLAEKGIQALVLKGAALCHSLYPEIGLRPMRDIDLLIDRADIQTAQDLLKLAGFVESTAPRPADHFHLPSLHQKVGSVSVCIELHHALFPNCPPYYRQADFKSLAAKAQGFDLAGTAAYQLGDEDMLWHLFEHGLHMPLTYEAFKLIAVADIVTLVEERLELIDWEAVARHDPQVLAALPLLHFLTPWQEKVIAKFAWPQRRSPAGIGQTFQGWPHLRLAEQRHKGRLDLLLDTFFPPEWWTRLYYGVANRRQWLICRWWHHPRHVYWWARLYASLDKKGGSWVKAIWAKFAKSHWVRPPG